MLSKCIWLGYITEGGAGWGCSSPTQHLYRIHTMQKLHDKLLTLQNNINKHLPGLMGYLIITITLFSATLIKLSTKKNLKETHWEGGWFFTTYLQNRACTVLLNVSAEWTSVKYISLLCDKTVYLFILKQRQNPSCVEQAELTFHWLQQSIFFISGWCPA